MNFDHLLNRQNTASIKFDIENKFKVNNKDIIPLWIADMDFNTPKFIVDEIKHRAQHEIYGYTNIDFRHAVKHWQKRHDYNIETEWVVPISNIIAGISTAVLNFAAAGDKIIINPPVYPAFFSAIQANKRFISPAHLKQKNHFFEFDLHNFDEEAKVFILCNPHNPVGRAWTRKELIQVGEFCLENNIIIVSDEVHSDFTYKGIKHIPIASISSEFEDITITLNSASKTFNISGLGAAYAIIANKQLRDTFQNFVMDTHLFPTLFGSLATKIAYEQGEKWPAELMSYLEKNRDYAVNFLHKEIPNIKVIKPEASYLLWLDFSFLNMSHQEIENLLLTKAKIALSSGTEFGIEKYFRLNIATSLDTLKVAMERLNNLAL